MKKEKEKKLDITALKRLVKYLFKTQKKYLICIITSLLISTIGPLCVAIFTKTVLNDIIEPAIKNGGFEYVQSEYYVLLGIIVGLYLLSFVCVFISTRLSAIMSQKFLYQIRLDMFTKMETLPISYFDTHKRGDIMSTYTNDTETIRELVCNTIPGLISAFFIIFGVSVVMMIFSVTLGLIVISSGIAIYFSVKIVGGKSARHFIAQQETLADVEGYVEEMMNGQKVIKTFCHEEKAIEGFIEKNEECRMHTYKATANSNILTPIIHNIGNILYVIVAILGTVMVVTETPNVTFTGLSLLQVGTVISFLTLAKQFANNFTQISQNIYTITIGLAGANRIFKLLDQDSEVDEGYVELVNASVDELGNIKEEDHRTGVWAWKHPHQDGTTTFTLLKGDIRLYDVDFGYTKDKIVLHDVSIYAKPGQKIALVGATGAGKTTITNLITRFYDLADGKVRFDGININKIKKKDLRHSIGMVLQDTSLFNGTVKDNIKYGKLDATDEEVIEAAKEANAYDFIMRLPKGFDTELVANGDNLSQGQRQLISIARAAIADAPVMILDEATSSIDTRTEKLVEKGMDKIMEGRTIFVIAHRLSTIRNSNAIMVMDNGRIIERGDHDSLIKEGGVYYQLYTGAFELE